MALSEGKDIFKVLIIKLLRLIPDSILKLPLKYKSYKGLKVVDLMRTTHLSILRMIGLSVEVMFLRAEEISG